MPDPAPQPLPYATPATLDEHNLVIRTGRGPALIVIVWGGLFLGLPFAGLLGPPGQGGLPWLVAGVSSAVIALGVWRLVRRPVRLVLDDAALRSVPFALTVPWAHVADALLVYHKSSILLVLKLHDTAPAPAHRPEAPHAVEADDRDLVLPISGLEWPAETVLAEVRKRVAKSVA